MEKQNNTYLVHIDKSSEEYRVPLETVPSQEYAENLAYEKTKKTDADGTECWAVKEETVIEDNEFVIIVDRGSKILKVPGVSEAEAEREAVIRFSQSHPNPNYVYSVGFTEIMK